MADHHTYFVGCDEWGWAVWAHNGCGPDDVLAIARDMPSEEAARVARIINGEAAGTRESVEQYLKYYGATQEEARALLNRHGMFHEAVDTAGAGGPVRLGSEGRHTPQTIHESQSNPNIWQERGVTHPIDGEGYGWDFDSLRALGSKQVSKELPAGTQKILERWLDGFGERLEVHYWRTPDSVAHGTWIRPGWTTPTGKGGL